MYYLVYIILFQTMIMPGESGETNFVLLHPLAFLPGDRFTIRNDNNTIGKS